MNRRSFEESNNVTLFCPVAFESTPRGRVYSQRCKFYIFWADTFCVRVGVSREEGVALRVVRSSSYLANRISQNLVPFLKKEKNKCKKIKQYLYIFKPNYSLFFLTCHFKLRILSVGIFYVSIQTKFPSSSQLCSITMRQRRRIY